MLSGIVIAAAWFAIFIVLHVVWFHIHPPADRFKAMAGLFLSVTAAALVSFGAVQAAAHEPTSLAPAVVYAGVTVVTLLSLFILYMPLYFVVATSLSVQTLILLRAQPDGALAIERLRGTFASRDILAGRLATMVANGYLVAADGRYRLTTKGLRVAQAFRWLKQAWRLGPGG